ncbi:MAG: hypothetical protein HYY02_07790 [Chloroflexi bacterium]|nr:hypothetical protein [Chloroflexota bacterium]
MVHVSMDFPKKVVRLLVAALIVALAAPLGSGAPATVDAHGQSDGPPTLCTAIELAGPASYHEMVPGLGAAGVGPTLGWWTTRFLQSSVATPRDCQRFYFELEPGTEAYVRVRLVETPSTPVGVVAATASVWCSWAGTGTCAGPLHHPAVATAFTPRVPNPIGATARIPQSFEVLLLGVGRVEVVLAYGALTSAYRNAEAWRPRAVEVPPDGTKRACTGDWDHTLYSDPSCVGGDESLVDEAQNDGNLGLGVDAGDTQDTASKIPLGVPASAAGPAAAATNAVTLGMRGIYVNNRLGRYLGPAGPINDGDDWYEFRVQPGAQVVINLWPTRYDNYGGGFEYEFLRKNPNDGTIDWRCSAKVLPPLEPVMNPALDCGRDGGYVPHRNAGIAFPNPMAKETSFYLHINATGFVRYSFTVDYLGNLIVDEGNLGIDRDFSPLDGG